jgi:hypothetical protein
VGINVKKRGFYLDDIPAGNSLFVRCVIAFVEFIAVAIFPSRDVAVSHCIASCDLRRFVPSAFDRPWRFETATCEGTQVSVDVKFGSVKK